MTAERICFQGHTTPSAAPLQMLLVSKTHVCLTVICVPAQFVCTAIAIVATDLSFCCPFLLFLPILLLRLLLLLLHHHLSQAVCLDLLDTFASRERLLPLPLLPELVFVFVLPLSVVVRITEETPSVFWVVNTTLALSNMPSFNEITRNCDCEKWVFNRRPMFCVWDRSSAASTWKKVQK